MRYLTILALLFVLSGCGGTAITADSVAAAIKSSCGIAVTVADIAALIAKSPQVTSVDALVNEVCNAFKAQAPTVAAGTQSGVIFVDDVPIHYTK